MECPKCRSKNLNFLPWLGQIYQCRNCGYRGPVVIKKKKLKKQKQELKNLNY